MHVRRALLLFAIVLGLAAIAASVSRSPEESGEQAPDPVVQTAPEAPSLAPGDAAPVSGVRELSFEASLEQTRRIDVGRPATLLVSVDEPGLVEVADLGLSAPADPLTPARFEVLTSAPNRLPITFTPVEGDAPEGAGTLVIRAAAEG